MAVDLILYAALSTEAAAGAAAVTAAATVAVEAGLAEATAAWGAGALAGAEAAGMVGVGGALGGAATGLIGESLATGAGADLVAGFGTEGLIDGVAGSALTEGLGGGAASGATEGFAASGESLGAASGTEAAEAGAVDLFAEPAAAPEVAAPEVAAPEVALGEPQTAFDPGASGNEFSQLAKAQPDGRGVLEQLMQWGKQNPSLASALTQGTFGVVRGVGQAMSAEAQQQRALKNQMELEEFRRRFASQGQYRGSVGISPGRVPTSNANAITQRPASGILAGRMK